MKVKILSICVLGIVFVYGILVGAKKIFPYEQMKNLKIYILEKESKKTYNVFENPYDDINKPNVLIIGDSISIGYTQYVRDKLKTKVDIFRIPENSRYTNYGKRQIKEWLSINNHWDVIHFNWGLWDLRYIDPDSEKNIKGIQRTTINEYRDNLEYLVKELKSTGAKLIWCNTTPVPEGADARINDDVIKYNEVAMEIMNKYNIKINDLYSYSLKGSINMQLPKNVHYTEEGSKYLAKKVSYEIEDILK